MPRLSIKDQRAKEIISAFERCIARNGLKGAQLEKIAAESGIQRPALRHFVGNRDKLILELTKSIATEYSHMQSTAQMLLNKLGHTPENLMVVLFMQSRLTTSDRLIVIASLYSISNRYPQVKTQLKGWYLHYLGWIVKQLKIISPEAPDEQLEKVAITLLSISFNYSSMAPLDIKDKEYENLISVGKKMIDTLT